MDTVKILDAALNAFTVETASRLQWIPVDYDPYATLAEMQADYAKTGRIKVSTLYSDNSIYGEPFVNWCSRAWHDYAHLAVQGEFDAEGEKAAAACQIEQVFRELGPTEQAYKFARIIDCEVNGQVEYYLQHEDFPANGYEFTKERLGL